MAGQPGRAQTSFASGELGDILAERKSLKYYRSGLKRLENAVVLAQGPATLRPYTRLIGRRRGLLAPIALAGATLSAPNGGTAGNATDGNPATVLTSNSLSGGPHVLLTVTFAGPVAVAAVDVDAYRAAGTGRIAVEYLDGGTWMPLNGDRKVLAADRSRRFCAAPAEPVTAAQWRVSVSALATGGACRITGVAFWSEGETAAARLRPFSFSRAASYDLVLTGGHGDVYAAEGGWLAGFALPHGADEVVAAGWRQQLNTGLIFSQTRQPWRIFRENDDREWQTGAAPLEHIPDHDFGDVAYTNGVAAVWDLQFVNFDVGATFAITVEGEETDSIVLANNDFNTQAIAGKIRTAIEALPNIEPGITVTHASFTSRVTFSGADNIGPVVINSTRVLNKSDAALSWQRVTKGKKGGEPIHADARGWPRCGAFFQQRLLMAGAPLTPNAFLASLTGDYFDFNTELSSATGAFVAPIDTEGDETILDFLTGRSLLLFTSAGEWWLSNSTLAKDTVPAPVRASSHGLRPGSSVVENEGGAVFIAREGGTICEFRYNETDQTYVTSRISLLASHLVEDAVDLALRRATTDEDAALLAVLQADGELRLAALLREQDVTAFSRVETDGWFESVAVNGANDLTAIVERRVGDDRVSFIERFEPGLLLDQAVTLSRPEASATVTGLDDHEGVLVWAIAHDEMFEIPGDVLGPFLVEGGAITLPEPAKVVTVGRWKPFRAETLPPAREVGPEIVVQSDIGYHTVRASVKDTTSIAIGANGGAPADVPLRELDTPSDLPELLAGVTGLRDVDGLAGSLAEPSIVVTQSRPGRLTLRSIVGEGDL